MHDLLAFFMRYYFGDQTRNDEMGWTCSKHEEVEEMHNNFSRKPEGKRPRIILKLTKK
jgi:hypothetical protein